MKDTVRVSYDVPIDEHILLKTECVKLRIPFNILMRQVFHQTAEELKKKQLHNRLDESLKQAKKGKLKSRGSFAKYVKDEI